MTYEIYRYIFIGGAILAGILLLVTILLFVFLRIPTVIGDLTGATARKAIENIRNQNEVSGDKTYKSSQVNSERGKLTDKISMSGSLIRNGSGVIGGAMATEKISTQQLPVQTQENETTVLSMDTGETTVLNISAGETDVLSVNSNMGETMVLDYGQPAIFEIEYEITYIHTDEVINGD